MSRSFRLDPPEPRPDSLVRPRLLRSLAGRWHHRVTSLTGGAGLGKTTLLAQALAENRLAPRGEDVWIGVEPQDADADRLARVMASAIALRDPDSLDPGVVADAVWHRSPTEACLVLDDVHLLPARSTGATWLSALVESLPANGHVVLASRSEPPVPLSRFGTHGAVLRLAEDDLRFSDDELSGFAARRGLDPQRLSQTGGWPAMAELAASVERRFTGTYLWEEVLEPLGTVRRHLLAVLCDLGGADDELLSAAVGTPVELDQALDGIPLVARAADGWHVPHALWRDAPGITLDPTERIRIRRRAAGNLTERGRFDDAFTIVRETEQWDEAPAVLRAACLASGRLVSSQLGRWLAASPDSVRASPAGQLATGMHTALTSPNEAIEPLQTAAAQCRAEGDVDAEVTAIAQLGRLAWWREDVAALMDLGARVTDLEGTGHPTARALATFGRAMFADLMGDDAAVLAQIDNIEQGVLDPAWAVLASGLYASVRLDLGEPEASHEIVERFRPTADPVLRGVLDVLQLAAWWAEGRVEEVLEGIPAVEESMRWTGVTWLFYLGFTGATMAYSYVGDLPTARRCLAEALTVAPPPSAGTMSARTAVATASIRLAEGDEGRATTILEDAIAAHGLDQGLDRRMWRQNLVLTYVLVPGARAHWDAMPLRGHLLWARRLASAVVAVREGRTQELRSLDLPDLGLMRSALGFRFAAELAVGLAEVGRSEGPALLDALGPPGRAAVRELAGREPTHTRPARSLLAAVPAPPPRTTYLAVLGPVALRRGGPRSDPAISPDLRRTRLQALLAFLVGHRRTTRGAITAALWPDLDPRAAANNLGVTLNHLLRLLEPWRDSREPAYLLRLDGQAVQLVTGEHLRIDTDDFDDHLTAAARAEADGIPSVALEHDLAAVELYRDDLHVDVPEADWFMLDREHYRLRFVGAAVRAGQLLLGRGDFDQAQTVARRALAVDSWAEEAYAVLVGSALARGDRSGAHRLLARCREALAELGVEPSDATQQLSRRLQGLAA